MLYQLVVILHVLSVFGYLLAHGASATVAFALRQERDPARIRAWLELSSASYPVMLWTLLSTIVFGLAAAFLRMDWWRFGWIWISIVLLIAIVVLMAVFGANVFGKVRQAVGLPYRLKGKPFPAEPAKSAEEIDGALAKISPWLLSAIGYGGYALIAWLMIAKPF